MYFLSKLQKLSQSKGRLGSPGREASARALLARSLIASSVPYMVMGIGTIEWQLRAEVDTYVAAEGTF